MMLLLAHLASQASLDVSTDLARYAPGQEVSLQIKNQPAETSRVTIQIYRGSRLVSTLREPPAGQGTTEIRWQAPERDGIGYLCVVKCFGKGGDVISQGSCGVDVSSKWTLFPRYGYVAHFDAGLEGRVDEEIGKLAKLHINALQFYDFQWRHHRPLSPNPVWRDIGNRENSGATIRKMIESAHAKNVACMAYNLGYGGVDGYIEDGYRPEWRLFTDAEHTKPYLFNMPEGWATKQLLFFDPANRDYRKHLDQAQKDVQGAFHFDGWHMDQVGNPGPLFDFNGDPVSLKSRFPAMLEAARKTVPGNLVFNNVGGYGIDETLRSKTDVMYVELWEWEGQKTYNDIRNLVEVARSSGKPVVLAAYMNTELAKEAKAGKSATFNMPGVLLTEATIFASGATHIELGDDLRMLHNEYFPDHDLVPNPELLESLRRYYDFVTAYENELFNRSLTNWQPNCSLGDIPTSHDGKQGTVWILGRADGPKHILHLINLVSADGVDWRDTKGLRPAPKVLENVRLQLPPGPWKSAHIMSPDNPTGESIELPIVDGAVVVPNLAVWSMVVLEGE